MDKLKGVAKRGLHPTGDHEIHRDSWKSDVKNIALRKDPDKGHLDAARSHHSAPLSALKDPDSFGPPPKHSGASGGGGGSSISAQHTTASPTQAQPRTQPRGPGPGWGAPVPAPRRNPAQEEEEEAAAPALPYRKDTTGLRTDNLPPPPARRVDGNASAPAPPPRNASPSSPALPQRPQQQYTSEAPAPSLPPRMNDHPDEHTPLPPPSYHEAARSAIPAAQQAAPLLNQSSLNRLGKSGVSVPGLDIGNDGSGSTTQSPVSTQGRLGQLSQFNQPQYHEAAKAALPAAKQAAPLMNQGSLDRLGKAGVSVPGLDIGNAGSNASPQSPSASQGHAGQLSELQQRFAKMNHGTDSDASPGTAGTAGDVHGAASVAAAKKPPPPPPPPKKPGLTDGSGSRPSTADASNMPPPLPISSKPRPS